MYQQEENLDMEIDKMRILMMKMHEKFHTNVRREFNCRRKMTIQECINKESGQLQHEFWKPGRLKKAMITNTKPQHKEASDQL